MLRPLLLASAFALAAPAMAQEVNDDMAPPPTEGMAAPEAQDQAAPDLPPGTVPTGTEEETTDEATTHGTTGHEATETGTTSTTGEADTDTSTTGVTGSETTATTGAASTAEPMETANPDAGMSTSATTSGTFTGMGGPEDIQSQWPKYDVGGDGRLSPLEFAEWMASSMGQPVSDMKNRAVELLNESADELALVDTNGDWYVSQEELMAASPK